MLDNMISQRAWRRDPVEALAVPGTSEPKEANERRSMTVLFLRQCSLTAQNWGRVFAERFCWSRGWIQNRSFIRSSSCWRRLRQSTAGRRSCPGPGCPQDGTGDSDRADRGVGPSRTAEGPVTGQGPECYWTRADGQSVLEIPLQCGAVVDCGRLRTLLQVAGGRSPVTKRTRRRLLTLCALAACALEKFHRPSEWPWDTHSTDHADERSHADPEFNTAGIAKDFVPCAPCCATPRS